jgi:hypothetical protein
VLVRFVEDLAAGGFHQVGGILCTLGNDGEGVALRKFGPGVGPR